MGNLFEGRYKVIVIIGQRFMKYQLFAKILNLLKSLEEKSNDLHFDIF